MHPTGDLPYHRASVRLGGKGEDVAIPFYDVKFYPYTAPGVDPVFAVTGARDTIICRAVLEKDNSVEILRWFRDEDEDASLNSLVWSQDLGTGDPLVCVTGEIAKIKVLNVRTGKLVKTLIGHGGLINDLVISPLSPTILASASMDHSIRIWNLDSKFEKNPCSVICAGEGHKEGILTVCFHHSGRYLLSGGMDTIVNLWVIPELPDENSGTDKVTTIHYPHFSTTEIHTDFVDCVNFYDDLILSRASKENKILLWRIDGFSSTLPPPDPSTAPPSKPGAPSGTRSAFGARFQRLLQFDAPLTNLFYMRFGLFHQPHKHPILVMGNEKSKLFFWDLQRLEEGMDAHGDAPAAQQGQGAFKVPNRRRGGAGKDGKSASLPSDKTWRREESIVSNASSGVATVSSGSSAAPEKKFVISDPFQPIVAHKAVTVGKVTFATRQIAWSSSGEWCVAVGDNGMICLFRRWD